MNIRKSSLFSLLALLALAFASAPARAASVVPMAVEELAAVAEDIVHATVENAEAEMLGGLIVTHFDFKVVESYKGAIKSGSTLEMTLPGGRMGQLASFSTATPRFTVGEEVILFTSNPQARALKAGKSLEVDEDSPLVKSPKLVGGWQGKFTVVRQDVETPIAGTDKTMTRPVALVTRGGDKASTDKSPSLDRFAMELSKVLTTKGADKVTRHIPTVGEVQVSKMQDDAVALRAFDPVDDGKSGRSGLTPIGKVSSQEMQRLLELRQLSLEKEAEQATKGKSAAEDASTGKSAYAP
ncbi:MAG: hypothetical protein RLY93_01415 [Sumerlaeia bacterium]